MFSTESRLVPTFENCTQDSGFLGLDGAIQNHDKQCPYHYVNCSAVELETRFRNVDALAVPSITEHRVERKLYGYGAAKIKYRKQNT